ncbi:hypothetical protein BH11PSE14_BH11PSE14_02310 [soil metagenome]
MARASTPPPSEDLHVLLLDMSDEAVLLYAGDRISLANEAAALLLGASSIKALLACPISSLLAVSVDGGRERSYPRRRRVERTLRRLDGREQVVLWSERACLFRGEPAVQVVFRPLPAPATHDPDLSDQLTELPSRRQFRVFLQGAIARAIRNRYLVWVLYVDLDRFNTVNAAHGHAAGDRVLAQAAQRLQQCIRRTDFLASAGGDEFLVALEGNTDLQGARVVATRALHSLAEPFVMDGKPIDTSACIGISVAPLDGIVPDELLRNVDVALFQAKSAGRGRLEFYSTEMDDRQRRSAQARESAEHKLASLTPREHEVLERLVAGEANKMVAYMLGASMRTIEHHRARIMSKMEAGSLPELVRMVIGRNDA